MQTIVRVCYAALVVSVSCNPHREFRALLNVNTAPDKAIRDELHYFINFESCEENRFKAVTALLSFSRSTKFKNLVFAGFSFGLN